MWQNLERQSEGNRVGSMIATLEISSKPFLDFSWVLSWALEARVKREREIIKYYIASGAELIWHVKDGCFTALMECLSFKFLRPSSAASWHLSLGCTAEMVLYDLIYMVYKHFYAFLVKRHALLLCSKKVNAYAEHAFK
jgi:hypothetical protein